MVGTKIKTLFLPHMMTHLGRWWMIVFSSLFPSLTKSSANITRVKKKLLLTLMSISLTSRTEKSKKELLIVLSPLFRVIMRINIFLSVNLPLMIPCSFAFLSILLRKPLIQVKFLNISLLLLFLTPLSSFYVLRRTLLTLWISLLTLRAGLSILMSPSWKLILILSLRYLIGIYTSSCLSTSSTLRRISQNTRMTLRSWKN